MTNQINKNSSLSIGLALTLISIAFASGVLWMKIENFDTRLVSLETKVDDIHGFLNPALALN